MQKEAVIFSKHPLVVDWVSTQLSSLGWESRRAIGDTVEHDKLSIVEVQNYSDEQFLAKIVNEGVPVVIFSQLPAVKLMALLFEYEVSGVISLSSSKEAFDATIEATFEGEEYFDEFLLSYLLSDKYRSLHERMSSLSKREHEIIEGILDDFTNDEIAEKFDLSVRTVNAHKRNILQKLQERSLVGVTKMMLTYSLKHS